MKDHNYEFRVGDEVETVDGISGKIVSICHCEKCAERGFFEPQWETTDGKYSDYITVYQANHDFPDYRRIGKYVWNRDANEEKSTKNIFKKENKKMKEIKLTIDGKEIKLTDEQLKVLGIIEKEKHPFERSYYGCNYFCISSFGDIESYCDCNDRATEAYFKAVNYFSTQPFAQQVALHQLLYRKLLKFAYDNGVEDTAKWDGENTHWTIRYDDNHNKFFAYSQEHYKARDVYFSSEDAASRAIKEVVKPFVKEHPEFVW